MPVSRILLLSVLIVSLAGCATQNLSGPPPSSSGPLAPQAETPAPLQEAPPPFFSEQGRASWYGGAFGGKTTANGEHFDQAALTGAHRTLPFNTIVRVTDLNSGKTVKVRINDRGPFVNGRIIDLSQAAATALGMTKDGVEKVRVEVFTADQSSQEIARAD